METGVAVPNVQSKPISMGSAVNTKLVSLFSYDKC